MKKKKVPPFFDLSPIMYLLIRRGYSLRQVAKFAHYQPDNFIRLISSRQPMHVAIRDKLLKRIDPIFEDDDEYVLLKARVIFEMSPAIGSDEIIPKELLDLLNAHEVKPYQVIHVAGGHVSVDKLIDAAEQILPKRVTRELEYIRNKYT